MVASRQRCDFHTMNVHEGIWQREKATIRRTGLFGNDGFHIRGVANRYSYRLHCQRRAAVLIGFKKNSAAYGAVAGLNTTATRATRRAISFRSSYGRSTTIRYTAVIPSKHDWHRAGCL